MFDFDALDAVDGLASLPAVGVQIFAVSDIHTDQRENLELLQTWTPRPEAVLLLAGDVSHDLAVLRATFEALVRLFGHVFFCPGNHDLWLHKSDGCADSIEKLRKIEQLAAEVGVGMAPKMVDGVLIVPLHSWYHASFDGEPDVIDPELMPAEKAMMDFHLCKWPVGLTALRGSDSIARYMDGLNSEVGSGTRQGPVISFSHFLPRPELLPEKRALFFPNLAKAAGSLLLGERVQRLAPDLHIFGHTHYAWAAQLDGTRFVQACLAYPRERVERPFSVISKDAMGDEAPPPLLVYDHAQREFPSYKGFWSEYYRTHEREPTDVAWLYRGKRKRENVLLALRQVIEAGDERVSDLSIAARLT